MGKSALRIKALSDGRIRVEIPIYQTKQEVNCSVTDFKNFTDEVGIDSRFERLILLD
jgi:hypothetical protein